MADPPGEGLAGERSSILGNPFVWFLVVGLIAITATQLLCRRTPAPPPVIGRVPEFTLVDQDGRPYGSADLRGRVYVANFFFTSCTSICPALMKSMAKLQGWYDEAGEEGIHLVSISVDPERDRPDRLREYATRLGVNPERWTLLTGDLEVVRRVVVGGFKTAMEPETTPDDGMLDITHSGMFVLVDAEGRIRGYYPSDDLGLDEILHRSRHVRDARDR